MRTDRILFRDCLDGAGWIIRMGLLVQCLVYLITINGPTYRVYLRVVHLSSNGFYPDVRLGS